MGVFEMLRRSGRKHRQAAKRENIPMPPEERVERTEWTALGDTRVIWSEAPREIDIDAVLEALNACAPRRMFWRTSVVDLLALLGLNAGSKNRQALARGLGYAGVPGDWATMDPWLHREILQRLAANGGTLPPITLKESISPDSPVVANPLPIAARGGRPQERPPPAH